MPLCRFSGCLSESKSPPTLGSCPAAFSHLRRTCNFYEISISQHALQQQLHNLIKIICWDNWLYVSVKWSRCEEKIIKIMNWSRAGVPLSAWFAEQGTACAGRHKSQEGSSGMAHPACSPEIQQQSGFCHPRSLENPAGYTLPACLGSAILPGWCLCLRLPTCSCTACSVLQKARVLKPLCNSLSSTVCFGWEVLRYKKGW